MAEADPGREFARLWPELSLRCGAIPYRSTGNGSGQFLLIRRRGEDAWSLPKGHFIPGSTMARTAATEAFEEAGVHGTVAAAPIGSYRHHKSGHFMLSLPRCVEVVLFPLEVETQLDQWPEMRIRERRWFNQDEARHSLSQRPFWDIMSLLRPVFAAGGNE